MDSKVVEHELIFPTLPRSRKTPEDFNSQITLCHATKELYRKVYFEALDSISGEIQRRSEQTGYKKYAYLEEAHSSQLIEWNSKVTETFQEKDFDLQ
ncbi:hypothetical protein PR048_017197 [Dryococelus australis]|uniref:Uncharacterized protein n=1 Tax=Dryococelus australis TaxID=614101 RepID=A0ABQ9H8U9_9NEOP|nr:hypothetical protein PR048_017197 [Dryococelus australis]